MKLDRFDVALGRKQEGQIVISQRGIAYYRVAAAAGLGVWLPCEQCIVYYFSTLGYFVATRLWTRGWR